VADELQPSGLDGVSLLPLGRFVDNSGQLVDRAPAVLDAARAVADVVIIESEPLLSVHHGEALAHCVDVVLVVAEQRTTTVDQAERSGDLLRRIGAPVLGVVMARETVEVTTAPALRRGDERVTVPAVPPADGSGPESDHG
jgi:Mrp family chromosome partitioning ATPase